MSTKLIESFGRYYHPGKKHQCEYEILHCRPKPQGNCTYRHIFKIYKMNGNRYDFHCYMDVFTNSWSKQEALKILDAHFEKYLKRYENFVDLSSESSGSENFTPCTTNKTTKTSMEGK